MATPFKGHKTFLCPRSAKAKCEEFSRQGNPGVCVAGLVLHGHERERKRVTQPSDSS